MKAYESKATVGPTPDRCDHCGGEVENIGLVAPKCKVCGRFSLSHIAFGPPKEIEVDIRIEDE